MNRSTPTIVLTGGGTGGHITPLLSLARELKIKSPHCRIIYIGYRGDNFDSYKNRAQFFDFMVFIKAGKFRRYHGDSLLSHLFDIKTQALNIRDFFRLPVSIANAYRLMARFKPDVVFSKGGFVAVPVGIAAHFRGIPIVTHDSDTMPGLANRIIGRWATVNATGMPAKYYDYDKSKIEYVGVPVDERIRKVTPKLQNQAKGALKIPKEAPVLLLSGGSSGSQSLNNLLLAAAPGLLETNLALRIIHLTGIRHEASVKRAYKHLLPKTQQGRVQILGFSPDFYQLAAAADLVVGRPGATTLAELAIAGKACIIIPASFLAGGHQLKNAEWVADGSAAVVLDETVQADDLQAVINELLNEDRRRFELAKNLYRLAKVNAAGSLAEIILKIAKA